MKAFGENGAKNMVERLSRADEANLVQSWRRCSKTDPQQLARFLAGEHAQTKAMILGQLDPKQASALLMKLEPEDRADCVRRMATMGKYSPEAGAKASACHQPAFGSASDQPRRSELGGQKTSGRSDEPP